MPFLEGHNIPADAVEGEDVRPPSSHLEEREAIQEPRWRKAILESLDAYIQAHASGERQGLRPGQHTVFQDIRSFIADGGTDGSIELPTGFGKTVIFVKLLEVAKLPAHIVVDRNFQVGQTEGKFASFAPTLETGKVYGPKKEFGRANTIITYPSWIIQLNSGKIKAEDADLLILDEAHHANTKGRKKATDKYKAAGSLILRFSATLGSTESTMIHKMTVREAAEMGAISGFSVIIARTKVDISGVGVDSDGDFNEQQLGLAVNDPKRNQAAVDFYKANFEGQTAKAFCAGIKHAEGTAKCFNKNGVPAAYMSGKIPSKKEEREKILKQWNKGEIKVLCSSDLLIEALDEATVSVALNLRPTRSSRVAGQRGGRALRLNPSDPDKHAYIVDFIDKGAEQSGIVTYAQFAGTASVEHAEPEAEPGDKKQPKKTSSPRKSLRTNISGLEVIITPEEVMHVSKSLEEPEVKPKFLSMEDLATAVRVAGIKSHKYRDEYPKYPGWPASPTTFYQDWPGWPKFLGKEVKIYLDYNQLEKEVQAAGIQHSKHYKSVYEQHPGWPSDPHVMYKEQWDCWEKFLGKEVKNFLDYKQFKKEVRAANILHEQHYYKVYKKHLGWPYSPSLTYKEKFLGWPKLLGKEVIKLLPFNKLQKQVRKAGITGKDPYLAVYKEQPGWPNSPQTTASYKDLWQGWTEFLGREIKTFASLKQLMSAVQKSGVTSIRQYREAYRKHSDWPADPNIFYKDEWFGWAKLFGKES